MTRQNSPARMGALAALFLTVLSTAALTGCGGDETPHATGAPAPGPAPAPSPSAAPDTAFATPTDATDTAEGGEIGSYDYAETGSDQTATAVSFDAGSVSYGATLSSAQAYAGVALRLYAPGDTSTGTAAPLNASAFSQLRIHLKSTTDASITIKLQPSPVAADGCTPTATALVTSTLGEYVIDLDDASFSLPSFCTPSGTTVKQMLAGLYAIDVINAALTAGTHDVTVGSVSLVP